MLRPGAGLGKHREGVDEGLAHLRDNAVGETPSSSQPTSPPVKTIRPLGRARRWNSRAAPASRRGWRTVWTRRVPPRPSLSRGLLLIGDHRVADIVRDRDGDVPVRSVATMTSEAVSTSAPSRVAVDRERQRLGADPLDRDGVGERSPILAGSAEIARGMGIAEADPPAADDVV